MKKERVYDWNVCALVEDSGVPILATDMIGTLRGYIEKIGEDVLIRIDSYDTSLSCYVGTVREETDEEFESRKRVKMLQKQQLLKDKEKLEQALSNVQKALQKEYSDV